MGVWHDGRILRARIQIAEAYGLGLIKLGCFLGFHEQSGRARVPGVCCMVPYLS